MLEEDGLGMIVASSLNGVIGKAGEIPWHQPADLAYFKKVTLNKAILMGRKTWDSIGRPLPKRRNIVLTRDASFKVEGADVYADIDEAISSLGNQNGVIIGGGEIYKLALPKVKTLWWTKVHTEVEGDAYFNVPHLDEFELVSKTTREHDEKNAFDMDFFVYKRRT